MFLSLLFIFSYDTKHFIFIKYPENLSFSSSEFITEIIVILFNLLYTLLINTFLFFSIRMILFPLTIKNLSLFI